MSALLLRLIACIAMLIDHIGYQFAIQDFRAIGRIAFPIFVFLICNGYRHTSSRWKYALRLGLFALISQIPYSLFCYNTIWDTNGNVFFTLFAALMCIWVADRLGKHRVFRWFALIPAAVVCLGYHFGYYYSDYGARGILLALVFHYVDRSTLQGKLLTVVGMTATLFYGYILSIGKGLALTLLGRQFSLPTVFWWDTYQLWALCALPFIFAYNGTKGKTPANPVLAKLSQYGFYLFYPLHQLALWLIR